MTNTPTNIFLETERLIFRRFTTADAPLLLDLDSDPAVMKYINGGIPTSLSDIESKYLPKILSYYESFDHCGFWAVLEKPSLDFIGWFHFRPFQFAPEEIELGYRLRRSAWGKGYATEGSLALVDRSINEWQIAKVCAVALSGNTASINVMKKCGLTFEDTVIYPSGDELVKYSRNLIEESVDE